MNIQNAQGQRAKFWNTMYEDTTSHAGVQVPHPIAKDIADALKSYSAMRRVATVITTESGGALDWPNSDGRAEEGEQLDQNGAASQQDMNFGSTQIPTYKFSSKIIKVPVELWQDTSVDFAGLMDKRIASRIGRITNRKLTVGTGTNEPMGVVTAVSVGKVGASGQTATLIYDDLEDLVASVNDAYRQSPRCAWMLHEQTLQFIKKMKDSQGRPLNLVSRGADMQQYLLDYPVVTNNDMPAMAASAKSVLFGDFASYVIRDALEGEVRKLTDSALILNGQMGFISFSRAGGALTDVGGSIKAYQNAAS
jgi:HK97 family phage major capsid protein